MKFKDFEDQKAFEKWAFGRTPIEYDIAMMHSWNSHHGNMLYVRESDSMRDSLNRMYNLFNGDPIDYDPEAFKEVLEGEVLPIEGTGQIG